ncbi:MAG: DUF1285 domain-containing protein [Alphaproteobacteria bacterium]|nr:DUF1285 domain-containing protein [Alphaproteobacteria bacterium]
MSKSIASDIPREARADHLPEDGAASTTLPLPGGTGGPELCGDIDMRIARDGTWFYHGSSIGRKPLVKLFASVLHREADGDFWLITPAERCRIRVDDAPFLAVLMTVEGAGRAQRLHFTTNVEDVVVADAAHPIRVAIDVETGAPSPYLLVRGRLEALIARAVFYDLVELGVEEECAGVMTFGVWSAGSFFPLGRLDEPGIG